ncbi:MAG TPA: hypothetical protein VEJ18_13435 [Planctomycetota bacterium]|nr:hypothetical protein [Planctomycetota bacterium]
MPPGTAPEETILRIEVPEDGDPAILDKRLAQLDREWDVDRLFLAGGACAGILGILWGGLRNRLYLALPLAVFAFSWQHIVQGTCPPVEALRRLGFRTAREIQDERMAIVAVRKDLRAARRRRPKTVRSKTG